MAPSHHGFHKGVLVFLLILSSFGSVFAVTLLAEAFTGKGFAGSLVLGGLGLALLLLFVFVFAFSIIYWKSSKSD